MANAATAENVSAATTDKAQQIAESLKATVAKRIEELEAAKQPIDTAAKLKELQYVLGYWHEMEIENRRTGDSREGPIGVVHVDDAAKHAGLTVETIQGDAAFFVSDRAILFVPERHDAGYRACAIAWAVGLRLLNVDANLDVPKALAYDIDSAPWGSAMALGALAIVSEATLRCVVPPDIFNAIRLPNGDIDPTGWNRATEVAVSALDAELTVGPGATSLISNSLLSVSARHNDLEWLMTAYGHSVTPWKPEAPKMSPLVDTHIAPLDPLAWTKLYAQRAYVEWFRAGKLVSIDEACRALNIAFGEEHEAEFVGEDEDYTRAHVSCLEVRDGGSGGVCLSFPPGGFGADGPKRWAIGIALAWAMGAPLAGWSASHQDLSDNLNDAFDAIAELLIVPESVVRDLHHREAHQALPMIDGSLVESAIVNRELGSARHTAALVTLASELAVQVARKRRDEAAADSHSEAAA